MRENISVDEFIVSSVTKWSQRFCITEFLSFDVQVSHWVVQTACVWVRERVPRSLLFMQECDARLLSAAAAVAEAAWGRQVRAINTGAPLRYWMMYHCAIKSQEMRYARSRCNPPPPPMHPAAHYSLIYLYVPLHTLQKPSVSDRHKNVMQHYTAYSVFVNNKY